MATDPHLVSAQDLIVAADYGQIYIWSSGAEPDDEPWLPALYDAVDSDRFVGVLPGFIDLLTPGQWNFNTPMRLEVWSAEPPDDRSDWDHEVDADLDVPDGRLFFESSGGGKPKPATVPAGAYRVRVSGRGYAELGHAGANGDDSYRLCLWSRDHEQAPVLRKRWSGWDGCHDGVPRPDPWPTESAEIPGEMAQRDVVVGPGAVVVVALDAEGRVLLVSPHPVGGSLVELPAGECIEDPLVAAGRSLGEQAGLRADTWHVLVDLLALPGGMAVSSRVYLARDLRPTPDTQRPREGAGTWVALDRAVDDVFADVLRDGVVAAGIIAAVQARDTFWGSLRPADLPWPPDISIGSSPSEHCSQ